MTGPPGVDTQNGAAPLLLFRCFPVGGGSKGGPGVQENRLYQRMTERRNLHRLLDDATFVSHAVELQQAISDKAEYRVNHDATFV